MEFPRLASKNIIIITVDCTAQCVWAYKNSHHDNHLFLLTSYRIIVTTKGCKYFVQCACAQQKVIYIFDAFNIDLHLMQKQNWMRTCATNNVPKEFRDLFVCSAVPLNHSIVHIADISAFSSHCCRFQQRCGTIWIFFFTMRNCNNSRAMVIVTRRHQRAFIVYANYVCNKDLLGSVGK